MCRQTLPSAHWSNSASPRAQIDKRLLKSRAAVLRRQLEEVKQHRRMHRRQRMERDMRVVALVGYSNTGKSTLLNALSGANVLAEDKLFATLDPTTRRIVLPSGREALLTDTVGFIQKLPTQLVAAFRATLEEIEEAALILHVIDVSSPLAAAQSAAVEQVLSEMDVADIPVLTVWNKVDQCAEPGAVLAVAAGRRDTVCTSAVSGTGLDRLLERIEDLLGESMRPVEVLLPYPSSDLLDEIHRTGTVLAEEYLAEGTFVKAQVPVALAGKLQDYAVRDVSRQ